ncbi:MAG TPA: hypothetical protein VHG91_18355 [Longimicrobium sp.]|nr:hypothetical protein [Longimicrobium sp.]
MTRKIGLIVGREWSFPPAFIEEVNRRDEGVVAEYVQLGAPAMDDPAEYAVIIDRISHEVPFYRTYLKQAALQGCAVVNNPFMWTADDKFFGAALATRLGIAHPKTVVLPNKEYIPGIVHSESLRNLRYPLDWQGIVDYVGLPCILKDAHGGGWKDVYVCRTLEELIFHYDQSGLLTMIVQEFIEWDHFIRCICIGQEVVMPIKYDPRERKYHVEHEHMTPELGQRVIADSLKLVRALGYDMNSMEWAVKDGVPYAIDFMNPAPDMDVYSLTPHYFDWAVSAMADMAIRLAKNPRSYARDLRWDAFFIGSRDVGGQAGTGGPQEDGGATAQGGGGGGHTGDGTAASADGGQHGTGNRGDAGAETTADAGGGVKGSGGRVGDAADAETTADGGGLHGSGSREDAGAETMAADGGWLPSGNRGEDGGSGTGGVRGYEKSTDEGGWLPSGNRAGGGAPESSEADGGWLPSGNDDAAGFADAASAVPPEPAQGETAGDSGDAARSGEDTSPGAASGSTEETA